MSGDWTPGPWVIGSEIPDCGPPIFWISPTNDSSVEATIATLDTGEHDNEANANLLAAAPDLYEALFALFNVTATMKYEADPGQPHPLKDGVYDKVMSRARAALAKARGES